MKVKDIAIGTTPVEYKGRIYWLPQSTSLDRWLAAKELPKRTYNIPGRCGGRDVFPDDTTGEFHGGAGRYQIVPAETDVSVGEMVRVGTGYLNNGLVGRVTHVGKVYTLREEEVVLDEDHSYSGFRPIGWKKAEVKRVYFDLVS